MPGVTLLRGDCDLLNECHKNSNELPVQPQITPALAVAGVVLVFTGLTYLLIGIKAKRLNVFFSSGYLTNLAVTVLIIFVITPPVSNAVQGA
jgi:hypothetical protein